MKFLKDYENMIKRGLKALKFHRFERVQGLFAWGGVKGRACFAYQHAHYAAS